MASNYLQYTSNVINHLNMNATVYISPPSGQVGGVWTSNTTWIDFSDPFGSKRTNRVEADKYGFVNWEE